MNAESIELNPRHSGMAPGTEKLSLWRTPSRRLGLALLLFLALILGNLFLADYLHDQLVDTSTLINESGRLRHLSQEIAYAATRVVYKGNEQDRLVLDKLLAAYEIKLAEVEKEVRMHNEAVHGQADEALAWLQGLRKEWRIFHGAANAVRHAGMGGEAMDALERVHLASSQMLKDSNAMVNALGECSHLAHVRGDRLIYTVFLMQAVFFALVFLYLRRRVTQPAQELVQQCRRFALGDYSVRMRYAADDEIGVIARTFNQAAGTIAALIRRLNRCTQEASVLQRATRLLQEEDKPTDAVLREIVALVPAAMQYPEAAAASVGCEWGEFASPNFRKIPWCLTERMSTASGAVVTFEVCYLEMLPENDEGPFLAEERVLLKALAEMVCSYLERYQAQQTRANLAAILEVTPDLVATATPDGRLLYLNRAARERMGVGDGVNISQLSLRACHPEWANTVITKTGLPAAARDGVWEGETALLTGEGSEIPLSQVIVAHHDADGSVAFYSSIMRDISDRIAMEERLTASRDVYLRLFHDFPSLIWRAGADGIHDYFNKGWLNFTGRSLDQEMADNWLEGLHPEDLERYILAYWDAFNRRQPFEMEYRLRRHDGEYRWMLDRGAPFYDEDGHFAGYIGSCYDITARKHAQTELKASQEKLESIMMAMDDVVWSVSATIQEVLYLNPATEKVYGRQVEEFYRAPALWQGAIHPDDCDSLDAFSAEVLKAGRRDLEYRIVRPDGEVRWLHDRGRVVCDENGNPERIDGIARDITERKQAEENLRLWRRAIESSVNAVLIADATQKDYPIIYVNPAFERITGYSAEEVIGRNSRFLQKGDSNQEAIEKIRHAMRECREGRVVLRNYRKDGSLFWNELFIAPVREESGKVTHFIGVQNDITERIHYETRLEHQANHDELTGLPNRNLLKARLAQAMAYGRRHKRISAVMFLDLDYFKVINDSLGHDVGDALLKGAAERLRLCLRETDTVARQGGDEFVLILSDLACEEDVTAIAQKMVQALALPFHIREHELFITCSIGIALSPRDGEDEQTLLKNADAALYRAKDLGRNNFQFFTEEMNAKAMERLQMEASLRQGLERQEFLLHYQPQVDLASGKVIGVEALVRWQHPELGLVSPMKFIPIAEETGLIVPLGEWVLKAACARLKAWLDGGMAGMTMAVNLSARQFKQQNLVAVVARVLQETGLDSRYLELELTESLIMHNPETASATLRELKAMGVRLSVDDFGTGYSSLNYLKRFPIDRLKIDRSFVQEITANPEDAAIATAIISMAHSIGIKVIAEGVETEEQQEFLRSRQCDEMQGYYFSRPLPEAELAELLRAGSRLNVEDAAQAAQRTLLLVDDEENILSALTRLLRYDGYRILSTSSARAAFDLLAANQVGVIVCDQRMPEMSGTELLRRAKQLYPDTVRLVLSGYTELKSVTDAINEGAVYKFLTKPWDDDLLRANIHEAFQRYEVGRENARLSASLASVNKELWSAKHELETQVEEKTRESLRNANVLQVSQEILEYLPIGVIGVGEDGVIAMSNPTAEAMFDAQGGLIGSLAAECLPEEMAHCLDYTLQHRTRERRCWQLAQGESVEMLCYPLGVSTLAQGAVLMVMPAETARLRGLTARWQAL